MADTTHTFIETRSFTTHVAECGKGPPLLLLHGWPEFWATWEPMFDRLGDPDLRPESQCRATWEPMFDRLGDRYRLIAPDFRGFGESSNLASGRTDQAGADVLAEDIVALMDKLGIARAGFVGHDVGAFAMQRLAINHPDRVAGLFFFNCATHGVGARFRDPRQINEIWYQTFHQMPFAPALVGASRDSCRAYFSHFLKHWAHDKTAFDGVLERWVDNFMRPGNLQGGFNWYVSQNAGRLAVMAGTAPRPPKIRQPARVLWGRHDPVLRCDWIDVVGEYFENVEAGIAEDAGHFVHYETPDPAAAEIDRFFRRIGYRPA